MVVLCLMALAFQIFGIANLSHTSSLQFLWDESYAFQKSKFHDQQACKLWHLFCLNGDSFPKLLSPFATSVVCRPSLLSKYFHFDL